MVNLVLGVYLTGWAFVGLLWMCLDISDGAEPDDSFDVGMVLGAIWPLTAVLMYMGWREDTARGGPPGPTVF